jgi:hypothetical protein
MLFHWAINSYIRIVYLKGYAGEAFCEGKKFATEVDSARLGMADSAM